MSSEASNNLVYLQAVAPMLPGDLSTGLDAVKSASPTAAPFLEVLIRFLSGGRAPVNASSSIGDEWNQKQQLCRQKLDSLNGATSANAGDKRSRLDDPGSAEVPDAKRVKGASEKTQESHGADAAADPPLYRIPAVSITAPVRKKLEICIHQNSLKFTNPATKAVEASIPRSELTRAFIVPTRGKTKAHSTVVILTRDVPPSGRNPVNQQVVFGCDDDHSTKGTPIGVTSFKGTTEHTENSDSAHLALLSWLRHLDIPLYQPAPDVFKSLTQGKGPSGKGVPGIEAYRSAKQGTLWFMKEGILWGESKPCEFWALEDLLSAKDALTIIGGTGRTCALIISRKLPKEAGEEEGSADERGIETEFGVIDSREQEAISGWVRTYRHLFGKPKVAEAKGGEASGSGTAAAAHDDDSEESEFEYDSDASDGGSPSSSSGSEDDAESVDENAPGSGESENEDEDEDEPEEEEELNPEHHPLMRPGAMPRISRAAMDMVVDMVEQDMMGDAEQSDDGEDELVD